MPLTSLFSPSSLISTSLLPPLLEKLWWNSRLLALFWVNWTAGFHYWLSFFTWQGPSLCVYSNPLGSAIHIDKSDAPPCSRSFFLHVESSNQTWKPSRAGWWKPSVTYGHVWRRTQSRGGDYRGGFVRGGSPGKASDPVSLSLTDCLQGKHSKTVVLLRKKKKVWQARRNSGTRKISRWSK